ncbi:MAG: EscU/YscU/HrcU family type III secretion system export apparatus switch protein, partial [Opitutales bacterium]|nr:EscU/YscU/HrcU family type III secretion system export apparatus switch protein [Opitutales bacterium]
NVDPAPMVLAKGQDHIALKIREIAREHGVPVVENPPVARMLYRYGKVDRTIPVELYQMTATVLAYVYKTYRYHFHRRNQSASTSR